MAKGQQSSVSLNMEKGFFTYFYKDINSRYKEWKQDWGNIEFHVNELIKQLLQLIEKDDPYFRVSKIEPTGSYFEETKVRRPDEFDYMVVLDYSVFSDIISVESKCKSSPWFKRIVIESSKMTDETPHILVSRDVVRSSSDSETSFWLEMTDLVKRNPISTDTGNGILSTKRVKHRKLYLEFKQSVTFPDGKNDPTRMEIVPINTVELGVDLMLAFNYPFPLEVSSYDGFPKEYKALLETFGCHLVTKSCHISLAGPHGGKYCCDCWFISFASIETEMMKRLDVEHKKCYKALKCLLIGDVHYPGKCMNLSSYMLKSALLYHVFGENECQRMSYCSCVPEILNYLEKGFRNVHMPCFFARDLNVWGRVVVAPIMATDFASKQEIGIHSMLWVEFWRRVILVVGITLQKAYKTQDDWISVPVDIGNIRSLITFMLEEYLKSKQSRSPILAGVQAMCGPGYDIFVPISTISDQARQLFPRYIQEWQTIVDCKRLGFDCLINIDSSECYSKTKENESDYNQGLATDDQTLG